MARDNISVGDLARELAARPRVSYRLMLRYAEGRRVLQAMMVDAPAQPQASFVHDYGHVAFVGGAVAGSRVSSWLLRLKGRAGGFGFVIPKLQETAYSHTYPSNTRRDLFLAVPQPFSIHRVSISERASYPHDSEPLVKDGHPAFPSLAAAAYMLMYGLQHEPGQGVPEDIAVRVSHTEAWIELVRLRLNDVSVTVAGTRVGGTRLEVGAGPHDRFEVKLRKAGVRRFTFSHGVPQRLFVILSRGDRWLDYRNLDLRGNRAAAEDDVVIEPADDCEQIEGLILQGESETREFKREISNDKKTTFLKTVAGFANVRGGVIIFGVADETGEIAGVAGDVNKEKVRIINMIRDTVVPQPTMRITSCRLKGKQVIALFVEEGDSPPYGLYPDKPVYYIRRGATTFPATQAEVRAFALKNASPPANYLTGPYRL